MHLSRPQCLHLLKHAVVVEARSGCQTNTAASVQLCCTACSCCMEPWLKQHCHPELVPRLCQNTFLPSALSAVFAPPHPLPWSPPHQASHVCVANSMHQNCPVCFEYLFDSVRPIAVLPCGHTIHQVGDAARSGSPLAGLLGRGGPKRSAALQARHTPSGLHYQGSSGDGVQSTVLPCGPVVSSPCTR